MKTLFVIATAEHSFLYGLFYISAFLVSLLLVIYQGLKKHYPIHTWILLISFGVLLFIIGNNLITWRIDDLKMLIYGNFYPEKGRSILGGLLGLIAGLAIAKNYLKFNYPVWDSFAFSIPTGIAITRLGCLFGGCCYGIPTDLPWALQYNNSFSAFNIHTSLLNLPANSSLSLPVHPTQLYEIVACLVIILLLLLTQKKWRAPGNLFFFSVLCYIMFRFITEFFREPAVYGQIGQIFMGIKILQWMLLIAALFAGIFIVYREIRARTVSPSSKKKILPISETRELILFLTIPVFLILTYNLLAPFEIIILCFFMLMIIMAFLYHFIFEASFTSLKLKIPILLFFLLLMMSQVSDNKEAKSGNYKGWLSLNASGSTGNYPINNYDCNGNLESVEKGKYSTIGGGLTYHYKAKENHHLMINSNFFYLTDGPANPDEYESEYKTPALNIFVTYNSRYIGGTLGLNVFFEESYEIGDVVPIIGGWVGKRDIIFVECNFLKDVYLVGTPAILQVGIGSGFGNVDRNLGRAGLCIIPGMLWDRAYVSGGYFDADILVKDRINIRPGIFVGKYFGGFLGLQIHIGKDRWKSKRVEEQ